MKPHAMMLALGLALTGLSTADDAESVVRFSNNDRLAGSVDSLSADLLVWKSPILEKPTPFFLNNVMDLTLPATLHGNEAEHEATLTLTNGDTIRGQLASVTDDTIALDTWFAGSLNFNRLMVAGVKIDELQRFQYRGPSGMEGWTQSEDKPAWKFSRLAFRSNAAGSIARADVLPEECSISFDVAWKSDSLGLKVIALSDDPSTDQPSSGYEISFVQSSVTVRNCKTQRVLGSGSNSQALRENDRAHIEIRASSKSGKVSLFVNDRIVENWTDTNVAQGKFGRCLHFISVNTLPLRVSGIGIAAWDGVVDRVPDPRIGMMRQFGMQGMAAEQPKSASEEKPKEGRMTLANGDSLEGEVVSITDGVITVKTPLGEVKIPAARLRTVALKPGILERCKRRNGDIRAWFPDGSSIVFRLDEVGDGTLTGSSQNFGSATFKIAAFSRIEFNIHSPEYENHRSAEDW